MSSIDNNIDSAVELRKTIQAKDIYSKDGRINLDKLRTELINESQLTHHLLLSIIDSFKHIICTPFPT